MSIVTEIQRLQTAKADIKSAIENKGVTVGDGTIDTYAEKINEISVGGGDYDQGYEDGKDSMPQFDIYMKNGAFTSLNMFKTSSAILNLNNFNGNFEKFIEILKEEDINRIVEHLTINCSQSATMLNGFYDTSLAYDDYTLKKLTLNFSTEKSVGFNYFVGGKQVLETIDGIPLDFSSSMTHTNPFNRCYALKEVRFVVNSIYKNISFTHSSNLSTETIQSIIDGLADLTGGTAQTLTFHATVGAKLTDEQKAAITAKNWTLVY